MVVTMLVPCVGILPPYSDAILLGSKLLGVKPWFGYGRLDFQTEVAGLTLESINSYTEGSGTDRATRPIKVMEFI